MKFISGIFKLIAVMIMIGVILALPVTLLMRDVGNILFSPGTIAALLEENIFDADVMAGMAEYYVQEVVAEGGGEDSYREMLVEGVGNLSHEDWVRVINLIAPPKLITATFEQAIRGYFQWIEGPDPYPQIVIDLEPWKKNINRNSVPVIEIVINELPQCTPEQLQLFAGLAAGSGVAEVPVCRPPEPFYSLVLDKAAEALPQQLAQMPNSIDIGRQMQQNRDDLTDLKQRLLETRRVLLRSWLVVAALFIAAVPMGARSIQGVFKWAGWPLALAGIFGAMLAALMMLSAETLAASMGAAVVEGVPPPLVAPIMSAVTGWTLALVRPFLTRSVMMILFGGVAISVGVLIGRLDGSGGVEGPAASVVSPANTDRSWETPKKPEQESDDDSRPTGMFG